MIYFIRCHGSQLIKIGCATDPRARCATLQIGNPARLELLAVTNGGMVREREIHCAFADERVCGEWFTASARLIEFIFALPRTIEHPHPNELRKQAREIRRLMPAAPVPQRNRVNKRKLVRDEIHEIFMALVSGETPAVLGRRYGVRAETIRAIRAGASHDHLIGIRQPNRHERTIYLRFPKTEHERNARIHQQLMPWPKPHGWSFSSTPS